MRDNLDGVAVFVDVVEAGGFARAADRLALTRSAVGKIIARMEERLGVRLFNRTTRSQSLTDDGQIYYEHCLRALEEFRIAQTMLESGRKEVRGRLKISMPVLLGRYCIQPILMELAAQHPELELDLHYSDAVVDLIGERYDLAIRNGMPGEGGGLSMRKLGAQRKILCAAPAYLERRGCPVSLADLSAHEALLYWRNGQPFPWSLRDVTGHMVEPKLTGRFQFDNQEAIADAALRGAGLAWLPAWLVQSYLLEGRLVEVLGEVGSIPIDTYAIWPSSRFVPMRLRMAIDALAMQFRRVVEGS